MSSVRSDASACSWSGSASLRMYRLRRRCSEASCCGDTSVSSVRSVRLGREAMAAAVSAGHRSAWGRGRKGREGAGGGGSRRTGERWGGSVGVQQLRYTAGCGCGKLGGDGRTEPRADRAHRQRKLLETVMETVSVISAHKTGSHPVPYASNQLSHRAVPRYRTTRPSGKTSHLQLGESAQHLAQVPKQPPGQRTPRGDAPASTST